MKFKDFLREKNIIFSSKRYLQDALSAMAMGLFASLLIGLIIKTIGEQVLKFTSVNVIADFLIKIGTKAMSVQCMGAAIGVGVANALQAPLLVLFTCTVVGTIGAETGGPAGAFIATAIASECGKIISKSTKIDIIITPAITLIIGALGAFFIGPVINKIMISLGKTMILATEWHPFIFGIFLSVVVGLALTSPISSAALCIMCNLDGLAAGAATAGCCAQMIGFAAISYRENGIAGFLAQGLGTSMLQVPNISKNPWILIPPTLTSAIIGPISTCFFSMTNSPMGAGMGTSGLVGQIGTFTQMGFNLNILIKVLILHIALPIVLSLIFDYILRKIGKIKNGDYKLDL